MSKNRFVVNSDSKADWIKRGTDDVKISEMAKRLLGLKNAKTKASEETK